MKMPHLSVLTVRFPVSENYICYRTLYKASSRSFCISAMNVPLERIHSWICASSGSDWRRDCRVASSIVCMTTPCMVAVVTSAGNIISCSKSDFSIDLNVETLCPSQVRLHMRKAWDITLVATQALVNLLPQQIMPTHNAGVYLFALREIEIYQTSCCKAKAKRFLNILNLLQR